jgi:hypothetical protein
MKVFLLLEVVVSLALAGQASWQHFYPPLTDTQFAANGFVDTWEPHAMTTALLLFVLTILALGVAGVLVFGGAALRRRAALALVTLILAGASQLAAHIELTRQVAHATGQTFGSFYGLW